jgi:hypothetical protein
MTMGTGEQDLGPLLFDLDAVPWPTTYPDWSLCLVPGGVPGGPAKVWVECNLTLAVLGEGGDRYSAAFHDAFTAIGGKVAKLLGDRPGVVIEGIVRTIKFTELSVPMRLGRFGGEVFVFLPRPEFEGDKT